MAADWAGMCAYYAFFLPPHLCLQHESNGWKSLRQYIMINEKEREVTPKVGKEN